MFMAATCNHPASRPVTAGDGHQAPHNPAWIGGNKLWMDGWITAVKLVFLEDNASTVWAPWLIVHKQADPDSDRGTLYTHQPPISTNSGLVNPSVKPQCFQAHRSCRGSKSASVQARNRIYAMLALSLSLGHDGLVWIQESTNLLGC